MIERMFASMIPLAMQKLAAIPTKDKRNFAVFFSVLCNAYAEGDRQIWDVCLAKLTISEEWKAAVTKALWTED